MVFREQDLPSLLADFGVDAEYVDAATARYCDKVIIDDADEDMATAEAATFTGHLKVATFRWGAFPGLATDSVLKIEDVFYRVTQVRQQGDGAMGRAWCVKVE